MAINKAIELAGAGNYPSNRLNKRERKVLQVSNSFTPANSAAWGSTPPASVEAALNQLASSGVAKTLTATYDFSVNGGAVGSIPLAITIPNKAIITECTIDVLTQVAGSGNLTFTLPTDGIVHAGSIDSADAVGPQYANLASPKKLTADRVLQATIASAVLTAGKVQVFVRYVLGS